MDEAAQKGLVTRQRRWEARNEKRRQKALEEEVKAARIKAEDEKYMKEAIKQAKKAAKIGDVPIGCVLVKDGEIIARGYNRRNADKTVLSHAEVTSIKRACKKEGDWRLEDCTLYVTLEPCPMCAGAIVQARIPRVVIGSMNSKAGCAGSVLNLLKEPGFNHQAQVVTGILEEECSEMMSSFFTELCLDGCCQTARARAAHDHVDRAYLVRIFRRFGSGSGPERGNVLLGRTGGLERCRRCV